jgi:hypothetical protein
VALLITLLPSLFEFNVFRVLHTLIIVTTVCTITLGKELHYERAVNDEIAVGIMYRRIPLMTTDLYTLMIIDMGSAATGLN